MNFSRLNKSRLWLVPLIFVAANAVLLTDGKAQTSSLEKELKALEEKIDSLPNQPVDNDSKLKEGNWIGHFAIDKESLETCTLKIENIKAIGTLYPETIQIVTTAKSGIKSVEDLKGKKVSNGAPGSGTAANAEQILEVYGLSLDDIEKQDLSFDESVNGIKDGNIDAAFVTAGTPTAAVEELSATEDVVIVPVEADKAEELIEKYPYYAKEVVPSGTYKLDSEVPTVAVLAMLVVKADLSEDLVYDITKSIFENLDQVTHAKAKQIKPENALNGVGIEVHAGAQKYYDEKGIKAAE